MKVTPEWRASLGAWNPTTGDVKRATGGFNGYNTDRFETATASSRNLCRQRSLPLRRPHRWGAIGVAVAIAMFHAATAVSVPVWGATAVLDRADVGRSPALVTAALLSVAASALWVRHGTVDPDHSDHRNYPR
jgi:hypothetical protein